MTKEYAEKTQQAISRVGPIERPRKHTCIICRYIPKFPGKIVMTHRKVDIELPERTVTNSGLCHRHKFPSKRTLQQLKIAARRFIKRYDEKHGGVR